jgi:hypothetical protein
MLLERSRYIEIDDSSIILLGINPVRLLCDRSRSKSLLKFPMLGGIGPSKLLLPAKRVSRIERFPMEDGRCPER